MSGREFSTPRIFFGFLWRGALIGIAGGIAVPVVTIQLLMAIALLFPGEDVPFLIRLGAPGGALLGVLAAYVSVRLDGTDSFRERAKFLGYVGFSAGGFYGSHIALLALLLGGVIVIGPLVGSAVGVVIALICAWCVRRNFRPLSDPVAYDRVMRRYMAIAGFSVVVVAWLSLLYGVYQLTRFEDLLAVAVWVALGLFVGLVSAVFAWCKSSCLTDWYARVSQGLPSPVATIWRDLHPTTTSGNGSV